MESSSSASPAPPKLGTDPVSVVSPSAPPPAEKPAELPVATSAVAESPKRSDVVSSSSTSVAPVEALPTPAAASSSSAPSVAAAASSSGSSSSAALVPLETRLDLRDEKFEEEEEEEEETLAAAAVAAGHAKKNVNIVFVGHVDAGKSTMSGHILCITGGVDQRTFEKYEKEAKAKNREGWKFAWVLDTTDDERERGKTWEIGQIPFETATRRYTILDAPGHKAFVPNMISGAIQADVAVLVISARTGEFESGFDKGGQTREHVVLVRTAGVRTVFVVINKMDDVGWAEARYKEIVGKLTPFLKGVGFNPGVDAIFVPVSGFVGLNLKDRLPPEICPWYSGPSLLELLDNLKPPERLVDAPVRFPVMDKLRDKGCIVMGKLESGVIREGAKLTLYPTKRSVDVLNVYIESAELGVAEPGDNVRIRLRGVEEDDVHAGFVLCSPDYFPPVVTKFEAETFILECKNIISAGYPCILHVHAVVQECVVSKIVAKMDKKTKEFSEKNPPFVKTGDRCIIRVEVLLPIVVEPYDVLDRMGRLMLRDEGKTIAVGVIRRVPKAAK